MPKPSRKDKELQNEFSTTLRSIISQGMERSKEELMKMDVVTFAHDILGVKLWPTQRAILKALYGNIPYEKGLWRDIIPHDKMAEFGFEWDEEWDELEILRNWKAQGKTNWEEGRLYTDLNLEAGMRSSKCLRGDSLVFIEGMGHVYLDEILPKVDKEEIEIDLSSFRVQTRYGLERLEFGLSRPAEKVLNLRTRYGYEIGGSEVHPLLVMDEATGRPVWKTLPEIKHGDFVCIVRNQSNFNEDAEKTVIFNSREISTSALARVVGYLTGDGHVKAPNGFTLTSADEELIEDYTKTCFELFGKEPNRRDWGNTGRADTLTFHSVSTRKFLADMGLGYHTSYDKQVPWFVRMGSREIVQQFLRGLYDTDGFASCSANKSGRARLTVGLTMTSEKLIREVQTLLLSFGIISARKKREVDYIRQNGEQSTAWSLLIYGESARTFFREIGFGLTRKQEVLQKASEETGTTVDKIPHLHAMLKAMKLKEGASKRGSGQSKKWNQIRKQCTDQTRRASSKPGGITYSLLPKVIDYFETIEGCEEEVAYLKTLQDQNLFFDEVIETWETHEPTYDVCVPSVSEFVANGIVSHNTSMSSIPATFEFFKLSLYDDPAEAFGLLAGSLICMLVLATSEQQAEDTLFAAIKGRIENSPYFQAKIESGEIQVNRLEILYTSKNLKLWAGHSSSKGLVGRTLMLFAMDEADRFGIDGQGGPDGLELYANVSKGCLTLRKYGSRKITISSAWKDKDLTDTLHQSALSNPESPILSFQFCTWDMNPEFMKLGESHPDIQQEYQIRGVEAMRDYAGIRPGAAELFFNKYILADSPQTNPVVQYEPYERVMSNENDGTSRTHMAIKTIFSDVNPKVGPYFSFGHGDPGLSGDSFGFVAGHPDFNEDGQLIAVINTVLEWKPKDLGRGKIYKVDFTNVDDVIVDLSKRIKLGRLTFDHWNSALLIQRLYQVGVSTHEFKSSFNQTVQREIYSNLREWINMKRVILPPRDFSPATQKLYKELEELKLVNGRRIDHPKPKGCFTGDTKVSLLDGREVSFEQLVEEFGDGTPFHVYAVDPSTQDMKVGVARNPRLTMKNTEIIAVTLDNGEVIRCTPDHRFMLRDGSWCEAKDLTPGSSLMPLYRKNSDGTKFKMKGYELFMNPRDQKYKMTHWMVGEYKYEDKYNLKELVDVLQCSRETVKNILRKEAGITTKDLGLDGQKKKAVINHKVVSVEPAGHADVYDISVDTWENFALTAGVFVHNSKDISDSLACVVWHIAQNERMFAYAKPADGSVPERIKRIGELKAGEAIEDCFGMGTPRNVAGVSVTKRRTVVNRNEWYGTTYNG